MQVELQNVSKVYGEGENALSVFEGLSHSFPEKGTLAIVGASGVGKSTLLHLLCGIDSATSGSVIVGGTDITALSEDELAAFRRDNIGFVFQFHHLLPEFTAIENVAMPLYLRGVEEQVCNQRAAELLELVGLEARASHRPGELSGGEKQRVAIARAMVTEPSLLLADEPTGNLDAGTAAEVCELLLGIKRKENSLLILVTHSRELAARMDHCLEMKGDTGLELVVS